MDTLFDHLSPHDSYFPIPQVDDVFASILDELKSGRPLCCFTGFPKSGKSAFLNRLHDVLKPQSLYLSASREQSLAAILLEKLSHLGDHKTALGNFFAAHQQVVLLIDNAHLLQGKDFDLLLNVYALADHAHSRLQVVLGGNGELMLHLGRPENRPLFNMLGSVWNLPKLTIGQSLDYVRFLLSSVGLAEDFIPDPLPLAKRAAGTIGVLRMLTITFALKALSGQQLDNVESLLDLRPTAEVLLPESATENVLDVRDARAPWSGRIFLLIMLLLVTASIYVLLWFVPDSGVRDWFPTQTNETSAPGLTSPDSASGPVVRPVAKTVFRKRVSDGPYSLRLGDYPSVEAMLLHLPRFATLNQPLFWTSPEDADQAELHAGRFETSEAAQEFATEHKLAEAAVALRPFVVTVGPLHDARQIREAGFAVGLPEPHQSFRRDLAAGAELQFALEKTRAEALSRCAVIEKSGLSCVVTEYE